MKHSFSELKKHFRENGYVVLSGLIPAYKINNILRELEHFKYSSKIFYSQSLSSWLKASSQLDEYGLLNNSFENFTDLAWSPRLASSGRDILQSLEILEVLKILSGEEEFCMWQNMFFDKSTATDDHIDSWFLDTNPPGFLVAAWVALEDINGTGGEFHVYPGSHLNADKSWSKLEFANLLSWSDSTKKQYTREPLNIKKGDVVFWHPFLIHGSSAQRSPGKSRKSLTAHYFPTRYLKGGHGIQNGHLNSTEYNAKVIYQNRSNRFFGHPISSSKSRKGIFLFSLKGIFEYLTH